MGRREENKLKKRNRLEEEGLRLFLEHGYDRTSIEQIVAASGVARGTFYLYFKDKHSLFTALMDRWHGPVMDVLREVTTNIATAKDGADALVVYQQMATNLTLIGIAEQNEILLAFREGRRSGEAGAGLRQRELAILDEVTGFTADAANRGLIQVDDPKITVLIVFGAVERLFYEVMCGTELGDLSAIGYQAVGLFASAMGMPVPSPDQNA